ncbi:MAG: signal peptidase II [Nitrospinae bacterium]|nr:signal peptidase II [Nitrospinota bacterium]
MVVSKGFKFTPLIVGALIIVATDQTTKVVVREQIPLFSSVQLINGLLDLTHIQNRGAAFSFLSRVDNPWIGRGFALLSVVAITIISYVYGGLKENERLLRIGLILILGGAFGNFIDRLTIGSVTDFIDVHINGHHWPAFNIADSCITIGAVLVAVDWFLRVSPGKVSE